MATDAPRIYYADEAMTLWLGDCMDVLPTLGPVDHVVTDPPYSEHTHAKQWIGAALTQDGAKRVSTAHSGLGFEALTPHLRWRIAKEATRLAARWTLAFCDVESVAAWRTDVLAAGLDYVRACIWDKIDGAPQFTGDRPAAGAEAIICAHRTGEKRWNAGGKRGVYRHAVNGERGAKPHPSTKPLALMCELIGDFTDEGETILDPFAGSGTTGVAAKLNGRKAILIEKNEAYCTIAAKRLRECQPGRLFKNLSRAKQIGLLK